MPLFNGPNDFKDTVTYTANLKKALKRIALDESAPFLFEKRFAFDRSGKALGFRPVVLVDYSSLILSGTGLPPGKKWTVKGTVRWSDAETLAFEATEGKVLTKPLSKFFKELRNSLPAILIDLDEADEDDDDLTRPVAPAQALGEATRARRYAGVFEPSLDPAMPARPRAELPPAIIYPSVTMMLPDRAGAHESFVEAYHKALTKAELPLDKTAKDAALTKAIGFSNDGKYAVALAILNDLVKDVKYPGVPDWVLDQAARRYEVEMLAEQYTAMINLLVHKRRVPADGTDEETALVKLKARVLAVGTEMMNGVLAADPKIVKAKHDEWLLLVKAQALYAGKLKKFWIDDQNARLREELRRPADLARANTVAMLKKYGMEETLGLAQMAQVQAVTYQKDPTKQADEAAQGGFGEKLAVCELASIFGYSTAHYSIINKVLRNDPKTQEDQDAIAAGSDKFSAYIENGKSGLAKLPVFKGDLIRCNKIMWQGFLDEVTTNGGFKEKSFMSAGKKKASGFGDVEVHIQGNKSGRDISMFSLHQTEGEVLFPPGASFTFTGGTVVDANGIEQVMATRAEFARYVTLATKVATLRFKES